MARKTPSVPVQHPGFSMGVYSISGRPEGSRGKVLLAWTLAIAVLGGGAWLLRDTPAALGGLIGGLDERTVELWYALGGLFG